MPHACRLTQTQARQQQQEYLRCAQCGPDPAAFEEATDHGLMLHMIHRCSHCKSDILTRDLTVGDTHQDRRQPGHKDAAPDGSPAVKQPPHSSQPVLLLDPFDGSPLPNRPIRDVVLRQAAAHRTEPPPTLYRLSLCVPQRGQKGLKEPPAFTSRGLRSALG